ncbi:MAG: hypothetical protein HY925_13570 [Elusimicrobia bacterium]|nr:hypothetical protein [Elusimicrobiota bacterium]
MESAAEAAWCDFCKEPFKKVLKDSPESSIPGAPPPAPVKLNGKPLSNINLRGLDPGERIPVLPPWARYAAWAFLAMWAIGGALLLGYYAAAERKAVESSPLPEPSLRPPNIP